MNKRQHYSPRRGVKEETLKIIFEITGRVFERLIYGLVWLVKIIGTIIAGILYGLAIGSVFVSKEFWRFFKWTKPYIKTFFIKYFFPTIGKLIVFLVLRIKYLIIYLFLGFKYFFIYLGKTIYFLLSKFWHWVEYDFAPWTDNVFIPWMKNKFAPFVKAKVPVVAKISTISAQYFALAIFYFIKGIYLLSEGILKIFWQAASILTTKLQEFFGSKVQYVYEHREEIKMDVRGRLGEYKLFVFWLLKPITKLIPDKFEKGILSSTNQLQLDLCPAIGFSDFKQLIREPRHSLLRKIMASWLVFFFIVSSVGIVSLTPLFDWLFQNRQAAFAADFTGAVKVSRISTNLSADGNWYTAMAYSGDGISGDAEAGTFNPIHPGLLTPDGAAGALALGLIALTAAPTDFATTPQFIGFRPNATGNLAGVQLVLENYSITSLANTDIVLELLRFPSASCTPTACTNYPVGTQGARTYPVDTQILRRTVWQFNQALSGENLNPGNYGRATLDFRFDPPVPVVAGGGVGDHYGIRFWQMGAGAPVFGVWDASAPFGNFPTVNGTIRTIGVSGIDNTNAPTMLMPLALSGNTVLTAGGMVAGNSLAGVGMATVRRTENEHWTATYSSVNGNWTLSGSVSGTQTNRLTTTTTGGTGPSWVNDGVPITTLTADSTATTRLCVASIAGFAVNQTINLWDSDTLPVSLTIASTNASDGACPLNSPSIITTTATVVGYTVISPNKNATVAQAIWDQRIIQGAEEAFNRDTTNLFKICVADASQFSIGVGAVDSVAIWNNAGTASRVITTRRVTAVTLSGDTDCAAGPSITLSVALTSGHYTLAQNARVAEISTTLSNTGIPADGAVMRWTAFNHTQNPTGAIYLARTVGTLNAAYAKNEAPATSATRYPFLSNRHFFFVAYGDANTNAPADGDIVIVGNGRADPDIGDSPNLTNDINWASREAHTVTIDRNWNMARAYTGYFGSAVGDGAGTRTNFSAYDSNAGWISAMVLPGSKLAVDNSPNRHYRITIPGKVLIDSDASLELGNPADGIPASSLINIYFDNQSPAVNTPLSANQAAGGTTLTVNSTVGLMPGDTIIIDDNNSPAITRTVSAVESLTVITVPALPGTVDYTTDQAAFVAKGPTTELPTGADRRAGFVNFKGARSNLFAKGSDNFRIAKSDLAVDVEGGINAGFGAIGSTRMHDSGDTWVDVRDDVVGNWQPLDPIAVAGGTNQPADNEFSSIRMGAMDDSGTAGVMPLWTGQVGAGGRNALPTPNMEVAEIGTIPLTNIHNFNNTGGVFSINYNNSRAWTIFGDGANTEVGDMVYFGDQGNNMLYALEFNLGTAMTASASYVWEYFRAGVGWTQFTPRDAYRYQSRVNYTIPLSADTAENSLTVALPTGGLNFNREQVVQIIDNDTPAIFRRISPTVTPTATLLTFTEPVPLGYTTGQNARVTRLSGGQWTSMDPNEIFTIGTGRRIISWTPSNLNGIPARTTINGINAFWVRARISSFTSWTASPTNQITPVGMSGIERVSSGAITMMSGVQEAKITEITPGASYNPNEQWTLEYGNSPGWLQIVPVAPLHPYTNRISGGMLSQNTATTDWHLANGDLSWGNYTVLARVRMRTLPDATSRKIGIVLRNSLDGHGYGALIEKTSTAERIGLYPMTLGVEGAVWVNSSAKTFSKDVWYWIRANVTGTGATTVLNARFWADGSAEPGTWDVTRTLSAAEGISDTGRIGLFADAMIADFDDVTVSAGASFADTFTDTGTWRVTGSTQGFIGSAIPGTPFTSNFINFTMKHKGGWDGVVAPEIGDKIYLSSTGIRSYIGLDASVPITTSNANTKYEVWDFEWNPLTNNYSVTGSASGPSGSANPGSPYTAPNEQISLRINPGIPTATRFGSRMLLLQDNILRNIGSWSGTNGIGSAVLIYPSYTLTGSPVTPRRNIETQSGTTAWRGRGTIDFWFKTNYSGSPADSRGMYLFDWAGAGAAANTNRIFVRHTPDGRLEAALWGAATQGAILSTPFSATPGTWNHFRLGWDVTANARRAWLNGAPFTTNQASVFTGTRAENTGIMRIGNRWTYDAPFDGSIDEFAIFDEDIDTSSGCNWGSFATPTSPWVGAGTVGCTTGKEVGINLFRASFDSAMNPQEGFVWADYAFGNPAMVFTNGADTGNERIRVVTYPQRTRVWVDNTGEKFTPSARIKWTAGHSEALNQGWGISFYFHHKAKRDSVTNPTFSPVLNLRRNIWLWSDEMISYTGVQAVPVQANRGFLNMTALATINMANVSLDYAWGGFTLTGTALPAWTVILEAVLANPQTSVRPFPTQTITDSVFFNWYDRAYTLLNKTIGSNTVGATFVTLYAAGGNIGTGYNAGASQNVGIDGSIFMGNRNTAAAALPTTATSAASFYSGRLYNINNSEFHNNGITGAGTTGALSFGAGVAKVTISNNIFSINNYGIRLSGNSFFTLANNIFDGHVSDNAVTVGSEYGAGIRVAQSSSSVNIADTASIFGRGLWNEADINTPPNTVTFEAESLIQFIGDRTQFLSPVLFGTVDYSNMSRLPSHYYGTTIPGSDIRGNYSSEKKDIINFTTFGNMRVTGPGLTDTMVRTVGGYGWRLDPLSSDIPLEYTANVVGVAGRPLAATGYLRLNSFYGTENLPVVTLSGLGMTGPNLTWTAAATPNTWQQFVVSGTPTESALAELKITVRSVFAIEDEGINEIVANSTGNHLPPLLEDVDKSWTPNQWVGYLMRDANGKIFEIVRNTPTILYVKGIVAPQLLSTTFAAATPGNYIIFRLPSVYLDDISVLSGAVDTGTLDFHSVGQPALPFLATGLTAEAVWSAQYGAFADITGSFGQLLNNRMAIRRGLVSDANASTTQFITDLTETTSNFYQNQVVVMMSGQNNGIARRISAYDGGTRTITVDTALPFAPAFNDDFVILNQYAVAGGGGGGATAAEIWNYTTRRLTDATLTGGGFIATRADIAALNNLSANQVWAYGARTLTGGVTLSNPTQIWNVATSLLTTAGSIGKRIVDNLDVAVSTRGTSDLTAADVWNAATRTITGITDPGLAAIAANVWAYSTRELTAGDLTAKRVWDTLLSAITATNSIGLLLKTNIDAPISTRASQESINTLITEIGTGNISAIRTRTDTINWADITGLVTTAGQIKAKTDTINWADVTAIRTRTDTINWADVIGIKLKTDTIIWENITAIQEDITVIQSDVSSNVAKLDTLISNLIVAQSSVNDVNTTVTRFKTNLINANDDFYNDGVLVFTSGLNSGQVRRITDYVGADRQIIVNPALTVAPDNGDTFTILAQTANASLDASTIWNYASRRLTDAQLDSGSLATLANLQQTETSLTNQIIQTQKITVGKIVNQETSIKSGNSLTILFRADSGMTGANRPKINVYNPLGNQVVTNQHMNEIEATGVYRYTLTFESDWGTGQFTVQALEDTNNTKDSINISVNATDLATVANTIDLLARDLISIRSTVSATPSPSVNSFGTNLTSSIDGLYNNALITFTSGNNAGVARRIENYDGAARILTIEPDLITAPAEGDSFTILKQIAVPTTKIATIQTDVARIKTDVALIKSRLDNVDSNISALRRRVMDVSIVTEDMIIQMNTISSAIKSINATLGRLDGTVLFPLLSISQESLTDIRYVRNKLADFMAVAAVQRRILEGLEAGIIKVWYTSGSVDLNIMITNPAERAQKIPVKIYLPKEARMEHIIDNAGMDIQYDVQLDTLYAQGEFQLGPGESLKRTIRMRDIWKIAEEDLNLIKIQAETLWKQLEETQFSAQALLLKNDLETRVEKILRTQAEHIASPQDKIMTFRENKESLTAVQRNLDELKNLVTQAAATRGFLGAFGGVQTIAVWGIIIAFVTGFGLLIIVLFSMWKHQMAIAGGQLALQSHILSGGKIETEVLAKIFADGVVTPKEKDTLKKHLTQAEIEKVEETPKKIHTSFPAYIKKFLVKFGKKILVAIIAIGFIIGLVYAIYTLSGFIKNSSKTDSDNTKSQTIVPVVVPVENPVENPANNIQSNLESSPAAAPSTITQEKSSSGYEPIFIQIKQTPTGWLNVRQEPSKTAEIIIRVNPGEKLEAIELQEAKAGEKFGWYRIVLSDGKTGWVYGEYVQIVVGE